MFAPYQLFAIVLVVPSFVSPQIRASIDDSALRQFSTLEFFGVLLDPDGLPVAQGKRYSAKFRMILTPLNNPGFLWEPTVEFTVEHDGRFCFVAPRPVRTSEAYPLEIVGIGEADSQDRVYLRARPSDLGVIQLGRRQLLATVLLDDNSGLKTPLYHKSLRLRSLDPIGGHEEVVRCWPEVRRTEWSFELRGLPTVGTFELELRSRGLTYHKPITLDETAKTFTFEIPHRGWLVSRLRVPEGFPSHGIFALVDDLDRGSKLRFPLHSSEVNNLTLEVGRYQVAYEVSGVVFDDLGVHEVHAGGATSLPANDYSSLLGVLHLEVTRPSGEPIASARAKALGSAGSGYRREPDSSSEEPPLIVGYLLPSVDLEVWEPGEPHMRRIVQGRDADCEVILEPKRD